MEMDFWNTIKSVKEGNAAEKELSLNEFPPSALWEIYKWKGNTG